MNTRSWLTIATFAVSLTIVAIILIIVPFHDWTVSSGSSLVLLSAALVQFSVIRYRGRAGNDARTIVSMGPSGLLTSALVVISAFALLSGLASHDRICWVLNVLAIGVFIFGFSLMKASSDIAAGLAPTPDSMRPSRWVQLIQSMLPLVTQDDVRAQLERLSESVRYAASNPRGATVQENEFIDAALARLSTTIATNDPETTRNELRQVEARLSQREASLKLLRTRA